MVEILNCPFCGSPAELRKRVIRPDPFFIAYVNVAGCSNRECKAEAECLVSEWNRRPTPPAIDPKVTALVEALRSIADMPDYRLPKPQDIARAAIAAWEAQ